MFMAFPETIIDEVVEEFDRMQKIFDYIYLEASGIEERRVLLNFSNVCSKNDKRRGMKTSFYVYNMFK